MNLKGLINRLRDNKVTAYYIFLFFFLAAKAWGLEGGDTAFLVMAGIGCVFCVIAFMGSAYSAKELALAAMLCGSGALSAVCSRKIFALFPAMVISASKDVDPDRVVSFCMKCWIPIVLIKFLSVFLGIIPDDTDFPRPNFYPDRVRHSLGYAHPNVACAMLLVSLLYIIYVYWEHLKWYHFLFPIPVFIGTFFFTYSNTGTILAILLSISCLVYKLIKDDTGGKAPVDIDRIVLRFLTAVSFIPVIISIILLKFGDIDSKAFMLINKITTGRLEHNIRIAESYPLTLFGQVFSGKLAYEVIDNAFVYLIMRLGMIAFLLFVTEYVLLIYRAYKKQNLKLLLVICVFMAYGFMEMLIINAFVNFTFLFFGELIWDEPAPGRDACSY